MSVVATSVDADCPTISTTVIVVYQTAVCTTPISLNISTPSNNTSTSASTILLQGTAVGSGVQVKVNNQLVTLYTSGVFESTIGLVRGTNTITVEAFNNDPVCTQSQTLSVSRTG
ncbi:MAG: hypothetical protein Q8O99_03940 [bacterium]|nr:hypothetical protein [bacterium]